MACLQQSRKCWQEICTSLTTQGKEQVSPHPDLGSRGPFLNEPCHSLIPQGGQRREAMSAMEGTGNYPRRPGPQRRPHHIRSHPGVQVSEAPTPLKAPSKTSTFTWVGELREASPIPRIAQAETRLGQTTPR